jgi:hypothetical protein
MSLRRHACTGIALAAAYAVGLQAIFLGFGSLAGAGTRSGPWAASPLCVAAGHAAPAGPEQDQDRDRNHSRDCLAACLTGCCSAVAAPVAPVVLMAGALRPLHVMAPARESGRHLARDAAPAHRPRAPPRAVS